MRRYRLPLSALIATIVLVPALGMAAPGGGKGGGGNGGGGGGGGGSSIAIVSLGDSYISGEAGRWLGNSLNNSGSRSGTDRAYVKSSGSYDPSRVYIGGTYANGCHRADIADIHSTGISATSINLACSGAETHHIWRASSGGQTFKGEAPQADRLATVASSNDVDLVVLSISGNDLGFSDIIIACTEAWFTSPSWWENHCHPDEQPGVDQKMPQAMADLGKAIDEVRAVMAAAGYAQSDYRFFVRSYPSPIPRGSENRYSESGWSRWDQGGCPFWNEDSDWARDSLVPQIANNIQAVAANKGVEFLDMRDALEDHEVCSIHTSHVSGKPKDSQHEWVRWENTGWVQGDAQESLHPNAFGQQAAGRCIGLMYAAAPGNYRCTPATGGGISSMSLTAL